VCALGAAGGAAAGGAAPGHRVRTLEEAADAAVSVLGGSRWVPRAFTDGSRVRAWLGAAAAEGPGRGPGVLGLYTGGTLAAEARLILEPMLGPVAVEEAAEPAARHRV